MKFAIKGASAARVGLFARSIPVAPGVNQRREAPGFDIRGSARAVHHGPISHGRKRGGDSTGHDHDSERRGKKRTSRDVLIALYRQLHVLLNLDEQLTIALSGEDNLEQSTIDLITRVDTATNQVAAKVQALIDKAAQAGSVTAAEVNAALTPVVERLEGIGHDPNNPVPVA